MICREFALHDVHGVQAASHGVVSENSDSNLLHSQGYYSAIFSWLAQAQCFQVMPELLWPLGHYSLLILYSIASIVVPIS